MRHAFVIFVLGLSSMAAAANYYVSSSGGSDSNSGTTPATPWKSLSNHVNGGSFSAGDVIYLKRGDSWNEQLIPPSNGTSGNPISFDAYGIGPAPVITAAAPIAFMSSSWTYISGSTWRATMATAISSPVVNEVQFGNQYGRKQPYGSGCATTIVSKYDWCLSWPNLYVYSPAGTNPVVTYATDGSIVPIIGQTAGLQMIYVNGKSWLTLQHIKVQTFDYVGVGVAGGADNLVFANMESDGMVPAGTVPLGFYVNATNPTSIQFLNDDGHLNYDGFRVDSAGAATAVTVTNCRGYANRDAGLRDNTPGANHVTYSYSHFYGNNIAQLPTSDVLGGIAGIGNLASTIAPLVTNFNLYPARLSFTVDDVGSQSGTEGYIDTLPAVFAAHGTGTGKFNAAVVPSYPVVWSDVNGWYAAGNEIDSHSWSHQYYTTNLNPQGTCTLATCPNAPSVQIQYTGSGTAATLSIAAGVLTTTVTGAPADSLSGITLASFSTEQALLTYLQGIAHYSVANVPYPANPLVRPNAHPANLASVSNVDIKSAPLALLYDQTKLVPDEMQSSKSAIQSNVAGLTESFLVYPDGIEDVNTEADAVAAGYTAARGSLAMKDQNNANTGANSVYANGVNLQNITSLAAIQMHGMSQGQIDSLMASLIFRAAAWGVPYGLFTHYNSRGDGTPDISNVELGYMLDSITAHGGTLVTNTAMASAIAAGTNFSGSTRYIQSASGAAVSLTAMAGSQTVNAGTSTAYPEDLNGVTRSGAWDMGASEYVSYSQYGQTGASSGSHFAVGGGTLNVASAVIKPMEVQVLAPGAGTSIPAVNTYLKTSPYINGIVYSLWWACSDQDGSAAHYNWSNFDNQVQADGWAAAGKKIMVVLGGVTYGGSDSICYGGGGWGTTGVSNYGTPAYVWSALGPSNYVMCNGQQIPNYYNSAYLNNYQNWVAATLAHLASASYGSSIEYVRVAWGKGGETTPTANWDVDSTCPDGNGYGELVHDWGYTLANWEAFLQNGMTWEAGLRSPLQLMISITPMGNHGQSQGAVPAATAPVAASLGIGFGTQGLMASDVNSYPCGGGWCGLFASYAGMVPLETQTFYQSCASTNESGTCPSMAVTTGTLDPLLNWAAEEGATSFEMYYEDACAMLCPGYNVSGYAAYPQAGYLNALMDVVGGPPNYVSSPTNLTTVAYPSAPNVGGVMGAGTTFRDPLYGTLGVRVTDAAFDPTMLGSVNDSYSVSNGGSADDNWFNTTDTLMMVGSQGGRKYLVGMNPTTLAITRPYATSTSSNCPLGSCQPYGGWSIGGDVAFSLANPLTLYSQNGTTVLSYTFDSAFANPPTPAPLQNYVESSGNCLPADFGTATWANWAGVTNGDAVFGGGFSSSAYHYGTGTGQGSGYFVAVFSPNKGCIALNTQTGAIVADVGWAGGSGLTCTALQCTGTANAGATFTLHNVKLNKTGATIALAWATCLSGTCSNNIPFIWVVGTTTVYQSEVGKGSGHWALGSLGIVNDPGGPLYQYWYRTEGASGPGTAVAVNAIPSSPACTVSTDDHASWQMANATDTSPFAFTHSTASLVSSGLLPLDQPPCAWINEVDLADMNGDGLVHRQALTFNTGYSIFFNTQNIILTCSPSGRFCATGSDWFNIRNAGGTTTSCIANGPKWLASKNYVAGYVMNPVNNNAANNSYQATVAGQAGGTEPVWSTTCPSVGNTCTDGGVTWTNIGVPSGANACGSDVFLWKLR